MKKVNQNDLLRIEGGKIIWKDFVTGFCDGLALGAFLGAPIKLVAAENTCGTFGIGNNLIQYLTD